MHLREIISVTDVAVSFLITLGYLYDAFDILEIVVQKNSDNAGGKPIRGFSLQHETFSALNYAQDFGAIVRESLKRTTNSKWATLTKSRIVPCQIPLCLCHHSQLSLPSCKHKVVMWDWIENFPPF